MTDYLYSVSLATQTKYFFVSLGVGFILGIFYDLVRIIRICISKSKIAFIVTDIIYCIVFGFCTFIFFLTVNEGEFRLYLLLGEFLGFAVYYFSLGVVIFSLSEKIVSSTKHILRKILNFICYPFRVIFGKAKTQFKKNIKKKRKISKNITNKSKFLLKVNNHLLYNLFNNKHKVAKSESVNEREV